jgi:hypothetical protein
MESNGYGLGMGLFDFRNVPNQNIFRICARYSLNALCYLDHLAATNESLVLDESQISDLIFSQQTVQVYVSYGDNDSNIAKLKVFFPGSTLIIRNIDEQNFSNQSSEIIYRRNRGFDLGAYRDGIRILKKHQFKGNILLINSSVDWDVERLAQLQKNFIESANEKLVFLTESFQGVQHYQTFFIWIPANLVDQFAEMASTIWLNWKRKRSTVVFGEQKLFAELQQFDIKSVAYYDFKSIASVKQLKNMNPSTQLVSLLDEPVIFRKRKK